MNSKVTSRLLIAIGAFVMFASIFLMEMSHSGTFNFNLAVQKLLTLIFGGVIFLAGFILFVSGKEKQMPNDKSTWKAESTADAFDAKIFAQKKATIVLSFVASDLPKYLALFKVKLAAALSGLGLLSLQSDPPSMPEEKRYFIRIGTGIFVGLFVGGITGELFGAFGLLVFGAILWYALKARPYSKAMTYLLSLNAIVLALILVFSERADGTLFGGALFFTIVCLIVVRRAKK